MTTIRRKIRIMPQEEVIPSAKNKWERDLCKIIDNLDTAVVNRIVQIPNYETLSDDEREIQTNEQQQKYRAFCKAKQEARVHYMPFEMQVKWYMNYL